MVQGSAHASNIVRACILQLCTLIHTFPSVRVFPLKFFFLKTAPAFEPTCPSLYQKSGVTSLARVLSLQRLLQLLDLVYYRTLARATLCRPQLNTLLVIEYINHITFKSVVDTLNLLEGQLIHAHTLILS